MTGTAPSAPRFRARSSTTGSRVHRHRRRTICRRGGSCSKLSDARLHAVSSRNMYSEHGFEARIAPDCGQVCQSLIVVWNWMPGSADAQAAKPICSHRSRAFRVFVILLPRRARKIPILVLGDGVQELVRHAHRVVGILARRPSGRLRCPNRYRRCRTPCPCSLAWRTG